MRLGLALSMLVTATLVATLRDARGTPVRVPAEVRRLVVVPVPMASVVMGLDGGPGRLVGIHPSALQSIKEGLMGKMFPQATRLPADVLAGNSFTVNVESLLLHHPDAVLQWDRPAEAVASVERAGMVAVTLANDPSNQDAHEHNLRIVGALLGRTSRVERVIAMQRRVMAHVQGRIAAGVRGARPKVLYLRLAAASFSPSGTPSYQNYWIHLAGGDNVARRVRGNASTVSAEQIVAWNPDVVFVGSFDAATPSTILNDSRFATVNAVRTRRVYKLPHGGYRWDPGSLESHLVWQWAAQLLHPGTVAFDVRAATRDTYAFLYNYKVSDVEIDTILQMSVNGAQAHYDAFRQR